MKHTFKRLVFITFEAGARTSGVLDLNIKFELFLVVSCSSKNCEKGEVLPLPKPPLSSAIPPPLPCFIKFLNSHLTCFGQFGFLTSSCQGGRVEKQIVSFYIYRYVRQCIQEIHTKKLKENFSLFLFFFEVQVPLQSIKFSNLFILQIN